MPGDLALDRPVQASYNPAVVTVSEELLNEVVRRVREALHPQEIYLFGSQAAGSPDTDSDIDLLAVVADTETSPRELARRGRSCLRGLKLPVDLIVCTAAEKEKWAAVPCNLIHTATQGRRVYAATG